MNITHRFHRIGQLFVCVAALTLVAPSVAQEKLAEEKPAAAGSWRWQHKVDGSERKCQIQLTVKDGKWSGKYSDSDDSDTKVVRVDVNGADVTITLRTSGDGEPKKVKLKGKVAGDKIEGQIVAGEREQRWQARRFISLERAKGHWRLTFTTPDNITRHPEIEVAIKNGKPDVAFKDEGEGNEEESGDSEITHVEFTNGLLLFDVSLDYEGQKLELEYDLEFTSPDRLEGVMYFTFPNQPEMSGDVDVTGERIKK